MNYKITTYDEKGKEIIQRQYLSGTGINWLNQASENIKTILIDSEEIINENKNELE